MPDCVSDLLAAERSGRMLALLQQPARGDEWTLALGHGRNACAFMTAARWAARFGATVAIRLPEREDESPVWKELYKSCQKQNLLIQGECHSRGKASVLTIKDGETSWQLDQVPDDGLAWRTVLADSEPMVSRVTSHTRRLSVSQCGMVDECAVQQYGVPGLCLMENAAVGAATVALDLAPHPRSVLVLAGGGNNGGDGLALARGLEARNIPVAVALFKHPHTLRGDALFNYHLVKSLPTVPIHYLADSPQAVEELLEQPSLIIDGLVGTGFSGALSSGFRRVIDLVNHAFKPVIALDVPSGLNAETGEIESTALACRRTVTFAAMKPGLEAPGVSAYTGDCYLADIGAPSACLDVQQS